MAQWSTEDRAPGCPFSCLHYELPLLAVRHFLVLWMETNFPPLLTYLKNSGTSQVGIFCSDILSLFSKKQSLCCIFFSAKTFFFLLHLNPELTRKVSVSIACPMNLHHWGYEKKKTFMFQQKSPDFQKIINTFKSYQRQLYKRIHEHSYIKENLEPGVPISADFQIACEWLDLAPHTPPPPPASQQTLHHNGIHGHTVKTRWTREGPGARTFMRIRLVWSSLVWFGLVQMTKQALENLA